MNNDNKIIMLKIIIKNSLKPQGDIKSFGAGGGQLVLLFTIMKYRVAKLHNADIFRKKYFL